MSNVTAVPFSWPCAYAIRAMAYLAMQPQGKFSGGAEIAKQGKIPKPYLAKLLLRLLRHRLVRSRKGIGGGYKLALPPGRITLSTVVRSIEGRQPMNACILEDHPCSEARRCLLHPFWCGIRGQMLDMLKKTTVADLVQVRLSQPPKGRQKLRAGSGNQILGPFDSTFGPLTPNVRAALRDLQEGRERQDFQVEKKSSRARPVTVEKSEA